MRHKHETLI